MADSFSKEEFRHQKAQRAPTWPPWGSSATGLRAQQTSQRHEQARGVRGATVTWPSQSSEDICLAAMLDGTPPFARTLERHWRQT